MKKLDAYAVFLIAAAAESLAYSLIFTTSLVYQVEMVGLNPLQLVLVGTFLEITIFVFEIPTGIVADVYSRRLSVILSMFIIGMGFLVEGSFPVFAGVVIGQMLWGLGYTFTSGARNAWLADEIGEEAAGRAYLRASQIAQISALAGTAISVALASIYLPLGVLAGGALFLVIGAFLIVCMPEHGFAPTPRGERSTWRHMADTFREGARAIRARPVLMTMIVAILIYGMASEGYDRLWTAHLLENFTLPTLGPFEPVAWFGLIRAAGMLLAMGPAELLHRRLEMGSTRALSWALMGIDAALVITFAAFALAGNFAVALIALLITNPLRALIGPLEVAWVNRGLEPGTRATVLSMSEQAGALGELSGGPILGYIGLRQGVRAALIGSSLLMIPIVALFGRTLLREPAREAAPVVE